MPLFEVDQEKCDKDGLCARACPILIISPPDKENLPRPAAGAEESCIHCGHCVAVCPKGALSHRSMSPQDCPPVRPELKLSAEQAEHFLRSRRSIRNFKKQEVEKQTLQRLIEIARYAPTGHNSQPLSWTVASGKEKVKELGQHVADWLNYLVKNQEEMAKAMHMDRVAAAWEMGFDVILRGAPHLVITHAPKTNAFAPASSTIALAYLELAAGSLGLGACWAGYFMRAAQTWEPLGKALELPEGHVCLGAVMVGKPQLTYQRLPKRNDPPISWME